MIKHLKDRYNEDDIRNSLQSMLGDMDWGSIRQICEVKKKYLNRFQIGGFQLKAQHIDRARSVILKASDADDFSLLFYFWCRKNKELESVMDALFETEKHTGGTGKEEEPVGDRELPENIFEKINGCLKDREGLYFLFFSDRTFSKEEELLLVDSAGRKAGSGDIFPEEKREENVIVEKLKADIKQLNGEIRGANRENKKILREKGQLEESIKKLGDELEKAKNINKIKQEEITRLKSMENEKIDQLKCEIGRSRIKLKEVKDELAGLVAELDQKKNSLKKLQEDKDAIEKEFNRSVVDVLNKLNSPEIIKALNEPDEVKDYLLSVLSIPTADEITPIGLKTIDINSFWQKFIQSESDMIKTITELTLRSADEQDLIDRWADLSDTLVDVKYSLRARAVMVDFVYEILREFFDPDRYASGHDLED